MTPASFQRRLWWTSGADRDARELVGDPAWRVVDFGTLRATHVHAAR